MSETVEKIGEKIEGINTQIKTANEEIEALKNQLKESVTKEDKDNIVSKIDDVNEKLNDLISRGTQESEKSVSLQIKEFLVTNKEKIKELHNNKAGTIDLVVKVPAIVTTQNAILNTPPSILGAQIAPPSNANLRMVDDIINLATVINTDRSTYAYTETMPKDGNFEFVAEGAIKPQIDFTIETNYAPPKKIAAWIKLTDEAVEDIPAMQSIAEDLLLKKHNIKKAKAILNGDGLGINPKGAVKYARAFVAGQMALKVENPNFVDIINAAAVDISTTHNYEDEMPYTPNLVLVNPIDFFINFISAKDTMGRPLYPMAYIMNSVTIGTYTIKPDELVEAGKILVCDFSKYYITNWIPYRVQIGWINDDFIKNQFVILGESRFHQFVKKLDEKAFVYDSISTIKTAITKP